MRHGGLRGVGCGPRRRAWVYGLLCGIAARIVAADSRPNFILILTDDQGWADAAFAGHPYLKTPTLDRLAREGTWFRQFYMAGTVCSPSRAALLTGREPAHWHLHGHLATAEQNTARHMPNWLDPSAVTISRLLRQAGYATAHFGKWHLGSGPGAPSPSEYGFDVHKTVHANGPPLGGEGAEKDPYFRAHSTRMIVDEAIQFLRDPRHRPFYMNVWTLLPHAPLRPTAEQLAVYENLEPRADHPAFGVWMQKYLAAARDLRSQMRIYAASITDLDTQIGRLLDELDRLGLASNTVVLYTSDNGPEDYRISNASNAGVGSTGPLRARKRSMYEGGIRVLGLVRWPGKVPAGRQNDEFPMSGLDWFPTVARLAGLQLPPDLQLSGEDVSDVWMGAQRPRRTDLYWEWLFRVWGEEYQPPALAIRFGPWKLFAHHDGSGVELYRVQDDVGELHNVALEHPEVVRNLLQRLLAWKASLPPSPARDFVASHQRPVDQPVSASPQEVRERTELFGRIDRNGDGSLDREEFLRNFSDKAEGERRFQLFDQNQDGRLSVEEFVRRGAPPPAR